MSDHPRNSNACLPRNLNDEFAEAAGDELRELTVHELEQLLFRLEHQLEKSIADRFGQIRATMAAHTDPTKSEEELTRYREFLFDAVTRVRDNESRVIATKLQLAKQKLAAAEQALAVRSTLLESRLAAVFQAAATTAAKATRRVVCKKQRKVSIYGVLPNGTKELVLTAKVQRPKRKCGALSASAANTTGTKRGCM